MLRYCMNCEKDIDFEPKEVSSKNDLKCPYCGGIIAKDSRHPVNSEYSDHAETKIGNTISKMIHIAFIFYVTLSLIGILGYVFNIDKMLYIATGIALGAFLIQFLTGTLVFGLGIIFLPIGAIAGFLVFKDIRGAFLGIDIVFLVRHIIRDIILRIIAKLTGIGNN